MKTFKILIYQKKITAIINSKMSPPSGDLILLEAVTVDSLIVGAFHSGSLSSLIFKLNNG